MNGVKPCPDCNGQGRFAPDPKTGHEVVCKRCKGTGAISDPDPPQRDTGLNAAKGYAFGIAVALSCSFAANSIAIPTVSADAPPLASIQTTGTLGGTSSMSHVSSLGAPQVYNTVTDEVYFVVPPILGSAFVFERPPKAERRPLRTAKDS